MKNLKTYEQFDFNEDDFDFEEELPEEYTLVTYNLIGKVEDWVEHVFIVTNPDNKETILYNDHRHYTGNDTFLNCDKLTSIQINKVKNNLVPINIFESTIDKKIYYDELPQNIKDKL